MFSTLSKTNFNFSARFILSSASAFNLDQSKILSFGKELNIIGKGEHAGDKHCGLFKQRPLVFMWLQCKSFENTVGKGEIARNEQFLLFPQCFRPFRGTFSHFHQS